MGSRWGQASTTAALSAGRVLASTVPRPELNIIPVQAFDDPRIAEYRAIRDAHLRQFATMRANQKASSLPRVNSSSASWLHLRSKPGPCSSPRSV